MLYGQKQRKKITVTPIEAMCARGEKVTVVTAYDATFAAVTDAAGVDCLVVADSLGMACHRRTPTVGVTMLSMVYHTQCMLRGLSRSSGLAG